MDDLNAQLEEFFEYFGNEITIASTGEGMISADARIKTPNSIYLLADTVKRESESFTDVLSRVLAEAME